MLFSLRLRDSQLLMFEYISSIQQLWLRIETF